MNPLNYEKLNAYISENVVTPFYHIRIARLTSLRLKTDILLKKNPYLYKAKNINTSETFIRSTLDAFLSSQEETLFGNLMEQLAIYICSVVFDGKKAEQGIMKSVDLEFVRDDKFYIVGIKSGIVWGNKDQVDKMKSNFKEAKKLLRDRGETRPIVAVNGCMYGKDRNPLKLNITDPELNYYKYCGQEFWELISGDQDLYVTIIKPLDIEAKVRYPEFQKLYAAKVNEMTLEFSLEFLTLDGQIDWEKLIEYVSKKG